MKFKGDFKKIRFFATIGLSAMAMVVATIGTFAWFQAKSSGADPRHEVEAGSAGLDITSVSGYRGKYVDKGNGTDYTDAVVSHYDTNASSRAENVNADQMTEIDADTPSGGEGYYLVGDGNFCFDRDSSLVTAAKKEAAAYEYAYGVKMKTTNQGDNIAFIGNVYLNSSWLFDIRHHYYTSENNEPITKDDYPATGGASGDKVVASGGHFQSTETGWFDIYLNNSNQIYLRATGSANNIDPKVNVRGRVGPSIRKAAVTEGIIRVYFNFGSWSGTTSYARKGDSGDFSSVGHSTSGDSNYPAGSTSGTYFVWDFSWSGSEKHWFHYYFTDYGYNTNRKWHPYNGEQWATNEYGIVRSDVSNANYQAGCTYTVTIGSAAWEYGNHVENGFNYTCTQTGVFVHYDFNDGATSNENVEVSSSSAYTTRAAPTKAGYTFAGWLRSDTGTTVNAATNIGTITSPITFTAQWTAKQTTVTLNQQTGSGGSSSVTATYGQNMPSATMPTNSGYTFGGYWTAVAGGGTQYYTAGGASARTWNLEDATKTLYAKWTRTVTLNNQSATTAGSTSTTVTYNKAMTAITVPTKTGYTFQGYYTATGGGGTKYYNANGSSAKTWTEAGTVATLYAYWVGNSYTVTFAQEGYSTAGTASVSATYGSAMPSITRPSKTNYTFQGYYTQKYGKGTKYYNANGSSARNWDLTSGTTLYAYWTPNNGTYIYVMNNQPEWDKTLIRIWFGGDESVLFQEEWLEDGQHASGVYDNVYKVRIPSNVQKFLFYTGTYSNPTQTRDIQSSTWQDSFETSNTSLTTYNMITIQNGREGSGDGKCYCRWGSFQSAPSEGKGYYLVGGSDTLNGASSWTFASGTKMVHEGVGQNGSDGVNKAELLCHEITLSGDQGLFQIWEYDGSKWKQYESGYGGSATTYCCNMKMTASGSYSIYINSSDQITVSGGSVARDSTVRVKFSTFQGSGAHEVLMANCDEGANNSFVIEAPLTVNANDEFYIERKTGATIVNYGGTDSYSSLTISTAATTYLTKGSSFVINEGGQNRTYYHYKFKVGGEFTFYYTAGGEIAVAPIPELGYGYYILLNQGGTTGSNLPIFSYSSSLKMKTVKADGATNKANYFSFYAQANQLLAFRSYVGNVDKYYSNDKIYNAGPSLVTTSSSPVRKVNLTDGADSSERRSVNSHAVKIMTAGYYNIFINSSDEVHIVLDTSMTTANFFKLNSIPTTSTTNTKVRNENTSLVIKVNFTLTATFDSDIYLDVIASANNGLASKLIYAVSTIDPSLGTDSPYDYMRKQVYGSLTEDVGAVSASSLGARNHVAIRAGESSVSAGNYTVYIFIDYKAASVSALTEDPECDYFLSLRGVQA